MTESGDFLSDQIPGATDPVQLEILRELVRIFGDPFAEDAPTEFYVVPLVTEEDALTFLRTVPAGTPWDKIPELVATYRASHPAPPDADQR